MVTGKMIVVLLFEEPFVSIDRPGEKRGGAEKKNGV